MAEQNVTVASAVLIPEASPDSSTTATGATKRRQSSISHADGDSKRPRLSVDAESRRSPPTGPNGAASSPPATAAAEDPTLSNDISGRRQSRGGGAGVQGNEEERRRGKRLFGSLLGTLSQSPSSSTKHQRRADIDRKQQEKLKLQAEEYDEERRRHLDELMATRKKEQLIWDEESMDLKHANTLAMAHFLKTKTTPVLYFKPWELRPDDKELIDKQIQGAEEQIAQEREARKKDKAQEQSHGDEGAQLDSAAGAPDTSTAQVSENVAANNESAADAPGTAVGGIATSTSNENTNGHDVEETGIESAKDTVEDNEEVVVEAGEDAVIW